MRIYDAVIVGGGVAGIQAAISAKSLNPEKSIVIVRKEATIAIPDEIARVINPLAIPFSNPSTEVLLENMRVELIENEVIRCDGERLIMADGRAIGFRKMVIATGLKHKVLNIPGGHNQGVFYIENSYRSLTQLANAARHASHAVIIGNSWVAVEIANQLLSLNMEITLLNTDDSLLSTTLDCEFCEAVKGELARHRCRVLSNVNVMNIDGDDIVKGVHLSNGQYIKADIVIISVGFQPEFSLGQSMGLDVDKNLGIKIDMYMRTSRQDVFAAGGSAVVYPFNSHQFPKFPTSSNSITQGRTAGANLFCKNLLKGNNTFTGSYTTKIGNLSVGITGISEYQAIADGIDYLQSGSELPGKQKQHFSHGSLPYLKLLFSRRLHALLGAQVIGENSVDDIINLLSLMIQRGMIDLDIISLKWNSRLFLSSQPIGYPILNAAYNSVLKWR